MDDHVIPPNLLWVRKSCPHSSEQAMHEGYGRLATRKKCRDEGGNWWVVYAHSAMYVLVRCVTTDSYFIEFNFWYQRLK